MVSVVSCDGTRNSILKSSEICNIPGSFSTPEKRISRKVRFSPYAKAHDAKKPNGRKSVILKK